MKMVLRLLLWANVFAIPVVIVEALLGIEFSWRISVLIFAVLMAQALADLVDKMVAA